MDVQESLLRGILATMARQTFPPSTLYKIVAPFGGGDKQLAAYNMCDGKTPQAEIGKRANLDKGNLSKTIARWVDAGIVIRVGKDQHPLHVYPLTKSLAHSVQAEGVGHG